VIVDCGAMSPTLLDSELFGHEKGAFTGADRARVGAFEEADGGTLFLDEIGELPLDLQPKLLRVLENREVRRLGQNTRRPVDFRLIAATNRDLRGEVNAGRFRSDLYYRLAVVKLTAPPLRSRPEDLPALCHAILTGLGATPAEVAAMTSPAVLARLAGSAWPGNVRELRNYLERSLVLEGPAPLAPLAVGERPAGGLAIDARLPYAEARRRMLDEFERATPRRCWRRTAARSRSRPGPPASRATRSIGCCAAATAIRHPSGDTPRRRIARLRGHDRCNCRRRCKPPRTS
jgi:two-component system response regulator GlrR